MKNKGIFAKIMLFVSLIVLVSVCLANSTYAWLKIETKKGIYPYYDVEFVTPSSDFYVMLEIATGEQYNAQTGEYETTYVPSSDVSYRDQVMYPGDSINLRFRIANLGGETSLSIYFTNILDTMLKDEETGEFIDEFLSQYILIGSSNFEIRTSGDDGEDGFLFYASDRMAFEEEDITPYDSGEEYCTSELDGCYVHNIGMLFAGNLTIPHSEFQNGYNQTSYDNELAAIEAGTNTYVDKMNLLYRAYTHVELQWYIMFDRSASVSATESVFKIGTVFLSVD